jgi:hypothetical protein
MVPRFVDRSGPTEMVIRGNRRFQEKQEKKPEQAAEGDWAGKPTA